MAVALQQEEVREVKWRVNGVLGGVVVAALRLLLLHAEPQDLLVSLGLGILSQRTLSGPVGLLPHRREIHLTQTSPEPESVHILPAAVHKQRGHSGATLLQLTSLSVDTWMGKTTAC